MAVSINRSSGRSGSRRRSTGQAFTDINVTPFVDVMLVLLVIFMVTTPMLTVGVPVDLPKTHAAKMNDQVEPLVVTVDANGKSYLQETELEGDALIERLIGVSGSNPDAKIYVRGDQKINYGRVMEIMGIISAAGFNKVSLIAEMPSGPAKGKNLQVQRPLAANVPPHSQVNGNMAPQGMQQPSMAPIFQQPTPPVVANQSVPARLPAVRTLNPVTNPANGPKVIRSK
ncbi:MAG: protein TolR [Candidatus Paracaedibacter sp.]|jgi:biopolymer transport protein TolR